MLDTIVFKIREERTFISEPEHFTPEFKKRYITDLSTTEFSDRNRLHLQKFILRKSSSLKNNNRVKVEIYEQLSEKRDEVQYTLRIEFSAPKLLKGNNLEELCEDDKERVLKTLQEHLSRIGIRIRLEVLEKAPISMVHIGKNILLPKNILLREILTELSKTALSQREDVTKVQYRNGNETLQLFSGVREYAFYDKIGDILRSANKAMDKSNKTKHENHLVDTYNLEDLECFRFEYRLKNALTLKSEINSIFGRPYETAITLSDLFSENLWKKLLLAAWRRLINKPHNQLALLGNTTTEVDLLVHILTNAKNSDKSAHSQNKAISTYGLTVAIKNHGVKMIKDEFNKLWSDKSGERLEEKIRTSATLLKGLTYSDRITFIDSQLDLFEIVTLSTLKKEVLE